MKRFLALLLAVVILLSLAACGKDNSQTNEGTVAATEVKPDTAADVSHDSTLLIVDTAKMSFY